MRTLQEGSGILTGILDLRTVQFSYLTEKFAVRGHLWDLLLQAQSLFASQQFSFLLLLCVLSQPMIRGLRNLWRTRSGSAPTDVRPSQATPARPSHFPPSARRVACLLSEYLYQTLFFPAQRYPVMGLVGKRSRKYLSWVRKERDDDLSGNLFLSQYWLGLGTANGFSPVKNFRQDGYEKGAEGQKKDNHYRYVCR
jgi:hypothetical protein